MAGETFGPCGAARYCATSGTSALVSALAQVTQFPICCDANKYRRAATVILRGLSRRATERIELVQPFRRSGRPRTDLLWLLAELNNADKHRMIPLTVVASELLRTLGSMDDVTYADKCLIRAPMRLVDGAEIMRVSDDGFLHDAFVAAEVVCTIAFDQVGDTRHRPVVPLLSDVAADVANIVEAFAAEMT